MTTCECGCGSDVTPDSRGRVRRYIRNHPHNKGKKLRSKTEAERFYISQTVKIAMARPEVKEHHRQNTPRGLTHPMKNPEIAAKVVRRGDAHGGFKGDKTGYGCMHGRLRRERWSGVCEYCAGVSTELALLHGHGHLWDDRVNRLYSNNRNDYIELCTACHRSYDMTNTHRSSSTKQKISAGLKRAYAEKRR